MQNIENDLVLQLERLAQAFPWDKEVAIHVTRDATGPIRFAAYIPGDNDQWCNKHARPAVVGVGRDAASAVDDALKEVTPRDPETHRQKTVARLQEDIDKLQAAVLPTMPPYVPNRELCERNPQVLQFTTAQSSKTIDI